MLSSEASSDSVVKNLPAREGDTIQSLGQVDTLEKEMATHSSILALEIPYTEEPGGRLSMGLQSQIQLSELACLSIYSILAK